MRRLRPLLLLAILVLMVGVGALYYVQRGNQRSRAPAVPKALPPETSSAASDWVYSKENDQGVQVYRVSAKSFKEVGNRLHLDGVELRVLSRDGSTFDDFKTATAEFDTEHAKLFADGEVEITTGEPAQGQDAPRRVFIRTSGLTFESNTGRAYTDRPAAFQFDGGEGKSVGASYEAQHRELQLRSQVEVIWRGRTPKAQPLKVEAGQLIYKESDSAIVLLGWSRLTRDTMRMDAGPATAYLEDGELKRVEAKTAHGVDHPDPDRQVEYAADQLQMRFSAGGAVDWITGDGAARLNSRDKSASTAVTSDHLEMEFDVSSGQSQLRKAVATGKAAVETKPVARQQETRLLRSEGIELSMQPGGREIRQVITQAPGVIEFLPNLPTQARRRMEADRILIECGPENRIRTLLATAAATRTEPPRPAGRPAPPVMLTWSKDLRAGFDPATSELDQLEQWNDFRYEQGDRRGLAERGVYDARKNLITLTGAARLWDPTGTLTADHVVLSQASGDVNAAGNVASTREPDRGAKPTAVLSESEPFHAKAARMSMTGSRRLIHYQGGAVVWQGSSRIEADSIEIDRDQQTLVARGDARSQFVERAAAGKKQAPVFTLVRSPELDYSDKTKTLHCSGGVVLLRAGLEVRSSELRGVFVEEDGGSQLQTAYADGQVRIRRDDPGRARRGSSEHAVYTVAESKIVLTGGAPEFSDSQRGSSSGAQLTWYAESDRLLVDGREGQPAVSRILRK